MAPEIISGNIKNFIKFHDFQDRPAVENKKNSFKMVLMLFKDAKSDSSIKIIHVKLTINKGNDFSKGRKSGRIRWR